jgi:beta-glucanase (GH16 family)
MLKVHSLSCYAVIFFRNGLSTRIIIAGLLLLAGIRVNAQCKQLVWADEFNVNGAPDPAKWGYDIGTGPSGNGWGNQEKQYYTNRLQNSEVVNGVLKITAKKENFSGSAYTSARMLSKGKFDFIYGRVEVRAKFPVGVGTWPAIWMLGSNIGPGAEWPACGEIDIAEHLGRDLDTIYGSLHYPGRSADNADTRRLYVPGATTGFHIYAMDWSATSIKLYVDGQLYHTVPNSNSIPFKHNFFFLLNMAMGGNFGGDIDPAFTSAAMEVDYIRVYKGVNNNTITGDVKVYNNETGKIYSIGDIPGAGYNWWVPTGASIVSGQGTNSITVNWGTAGGDVMGGTWLYCDTGMATLPVLNYNTYQLPVKVEAPIPVEKMYEDFQANRFITYLPNTTGTLTQAVANPLAVGANTSALVGKYIRNATQQYDVFYVKNIAVSNANDFAAGRKRLSFDIYTGAPVGSLVTMQLEDSKLATAFNYPAGRHSRYSAYTTVQNKWENLEFELVETLPQLELTNFSIDNIVFLFEPGINSGNTFYFDNVQVKAVPAKPVLTTDMLEHYEFNMGKISKASTTTGTYTANAANPSVNPVNRSSMVAKYVRNVAQQYDVLSFNTGNNISDAGLFKEQTNKLLIDVYTDAPAGTTVIMQLENTGLATGYPNGINSKYLAVTTKQNEWETLTFQFHTSLDAATSNLVINRIALLFNSNSNTGNTYYIDNIRVSSGILANTVGVVYEDYQTNHAISFNGASGAYTPNAANPAAGGINASAAVGKYVRNAAEPYDNISFVTSITNAGEFKTGSKKFAMDVYTSAPVGTVVTWQLENSPGNSNSYPNGRHSIYQALVQQTNTWHTLIFSYISTPDASTPDNTVNRFVLLFNPNSNTASTWYFDNLRSIDAVPAALSTLPAPWLTQEIGHVWGPNGNASYANNCFTVNGSGMDYFFCAGGDQVQFVYQSLTGDGEIIAKVNSLTNPSYARAGIMFKETLIPDSKMAMIDMSPTTALVEAVSRSTVGCAVLTAGKYYETIPKWIRLVRVGNVFTSYFSANGTTWTQLIDFNGPVTIPMANTVYVGMAVSSGGGSTTAAGVYSNVIVRNIGTTAPAFASITEDNMVSADAKNAISIYPNPAGDFVKLYMPGKAGTKQIIVHDLSGRMVMQWSITADLKEQLVNVQSLQPGLYTITIKTEHAVFVKKFVKQ